MLSLLLLLLVLGSPHTHFLPGCEQRSSPPLPHPILLHPSLQGIASHPGQLDWYWHFLGSSQDPVDKGGAGAGLGPSVYLGLGEVQGGAPELQKTFY